MNRRNTIVSKPASFRFGALFLFCATLGSGAAGCRDEDAITICEESPGALYERRIAPLLSTEHPNTCATCHTAGIDLERFLREDACESMACLVQDGLVNLDEPAQSVILAWIDRAEPQSELITPDIIAEEHAAFLSWIEHEAACRACAEGACTGREAQSCERDAQLEAALSQVNDNGACDRESIERLFRGTIYAERDRCAPCHFEEEKNAAPDARRWLHRTGDCNVASLATLRAIEEFGYIDTNDPESSLLLLKPLAEFQGGLPHGGHDKFVKENDRGYAAFLYFLERYSACANGSSKPPEAVGGAPPL